MLSRKTLLLEDTYLVSQNYTMFFNHKSIYGHPNTGIFPSPLLFVLTVD